MLGLDKVMEKPDDIEIKLKTKEIVNIKAISDTRASIFATSDWIANKFSQLLTKNSLAFNGAHAGSLQEKLEQDPNNKNMIMFKEKFYVVPNLPHKFILSRSALRNMKNLIIINQMKYWMNKTWNLLQKVKTMMIKEILISRAMMQNRIFKILTLKNNNVKPKIGKTTNIHTKMMINDNQRLAASD
ncbi:hypothetical protein RFI_00684 [Reticulomyxa filosa]|uniref:Uncharacterized protein n=1 Tax=Reticulomyxa filosa TaxID=46433 RepID=X6PE72_RETFI|nr:hypothetical protein RFI_00684 [Reticulomyxa filosa]|eukprot:ETO36378.1 hypothetical protein RFI_00684 [Reticulomyxa filosa]